MQEAHRKALLREVRRTQRLCCILRLAIMMASRHCIFPRWVLCLYENNRSIWTQQYMELRESLHTPFPQESSDPSKLLRRVQSITRMRSLHHMEQMLFFDEASIDLLTEASIALSTLLPAIQLVACHAQRYGVHWIRDPSVEEKNQPPVRIQTLEEILLDPSIDVVTNTERIFREEAATWFKNAHVIFIGDIHPPYATQRN